MTKKMTKVDVMKCMLVKEAEVKYEIHSSDSVADIMKAMGVSESAEEYFYLFCLNTRGQVISLKESKIVCLSQITKNC